MTKRINLISGPRNISTALMYSFGNRKDTSVVDEPMYAYYLHNTGIDHPGKEAVLDSLPIDLDKVKSQLLLKQVETPLYFIKNMAHHFIMTDWSFILNMANVFLIRDPKKLIHSFAKVIPSPSLDDIGLKKEVELFDYLKDNDQDVVVMDSEEVLKNPRKVLNELCQKLKIPFDEDMLKWAPGPRAYDGSWAKYWYSNVHQTEGFQKNITKPVTLKKELMPVYEQALPFYNKLKEVAIAA